MSRRTGCTSAPIARHASSAKSPDDGRGMMGREWGLGRGIHFRFLHSPPQEGDFPMRILFVNNSGAGFADYVEVSEGTTIKSFLQDKVHGAKPEDLLIRVN